jgi:uncharacterized protein
MDSLRIPLTDIPDRGFDLHEHVLLKDIQPADADELPAENVVVRGTLMPVSEDYLFRGHITGTFTHPCDRCLQPAAEAFELEVLWTFQEAGVPMESADEADELEAEWLGEGQEAEAHGFQGDQVDLSPLVWEEVALAVPTKYVCSVECQGLCPQCGGNLNLDECKCGHDVEGAESHPAFEKLRDMFPDLPKT